DVSSRLSQKTFAQLSDEDEVLETQVNDYNDQYLEMQAEVSDLNAKITDMETDKTLADLRHKFYILKNKVNDEAKDWASLSYLQSFASSRSEEHTSELQSRFDIVCRLLLEKKKFFLDFLALYLNDI